MSRDKPLITTDIVNIVPFVTAIMLLAIAFLTFSYDRLFSTILGLTHVSVPSESELFWMVVIIAMVAVPLAFLRIWTDDILRAASYLAWVLYIPSAMYFSGIDVFRILSISANFSIFTTQLSYTVIAIAGLLLACGSILIRAFGRLKKSREYFLSRGGGREEVSRALFRNAIFEVRQALTAGIIILLFAFVARYIGPAMQSILKPAGYTYLLAGLAAIALLALVLILLLWPRKSGEKT